jgi:molybdopterin-guanine dinucleotide biosynthesis protein A
MKLAAVLLAGGQSRRMGRDKATLALDGTPLWQRQLDILRRLEPSALLVSGREPPAWLPPDIRFVPDESPSRGPLSGIAASLAAVPATHLVTLAIDMPAMTAAHLAALWSVASPACGVLPWLGDYPEPLAAIYPAEALPVAHAHLAGPDSSMNAFTAALLTAGLMKKHRIAARDSKLYSNCNSPADWQSNAIHD